MPADDLSEYLRTRVSKATKADFEDICRELDRTPTDQLRELVTAFITREYGRLNDRIATHIFRPADYELGAWRMTIKLRNPSEMIWNGAPVPFAFPTFPKRRIQSDPEYQAITFDPKTHKPMMGAKLIDGEWRGHLYSNGIPEPENPTSIAAVSSAITATIERMISQFSMPA